MDRQPTVQFPRDCFPLYPVLHWVPGSYIPSPHHLLPTSTTPFSVTIGKAQALFLKPMGTWGCYLALQPAWGKVMPPYLWGIWLRSVKKYGNEKPVYPGSLEWRGGRKHKRFLPGSTINSKSCHCWVTEDELERDLWIPCSASFAFFRFPASGRWGEESGRKKKWLI